MGLERKSGEKDEEYFARLRRELGEPLPNKMGISRERVERVLKQIDISDRNTVSVVMALLDDRLPNAYDMPPEGARFKDGASTSHLFCHAGILQQGEKKIDREGRDYHIKPLVDIGAIEQIYLDSMKREFVSGHPKAKSPNNCYRLSQSFIDLLRQPEDRLQESLRSWISEDQKRERLKMQREAAEESAKQIANPHAELIRALAAIYVPQFLHGFEVIYSDFEDGERITEEHRNLLKKAGIELTLEDPYVDLLLWNSTTNEFWVCESVISDGEVDIHKVKGVIRMLERHNKKVKGFTTAYLTWKDAASRQGSEKNIAPMTYLWILEDPSKHWLAQTSQR